MMTMATTGKVYTMRHVWQCLDSKGGPTCPEHGVAMEGDKDKHGVSTGNLRAVCCGLLVPVSFRDAVGRRWERKGRGWPEGWQVRHGGVCLVIEWKAPPVVASKVGRKR